MEQTQNPLNNNPFWSFKAAAQDGTAPELILYGDISNQTWWGDEVTPRKFSEELKALGNVPEIIVRINSSGGDVFAANAIYTRLKDNPAKITVKIDGWAASAATIIAMAGDVIEIPQNGVFMVHDPAMGLCGYFKESDLAKVSEELKVIKQSIVNGYALKTGKSAEEIAAIMAAETWYDGNRAIEAGFCDKLMFEQAETTIENTSKVIVNSVTMYIDQYKNLPISLLNRCTFHSDSGFSNKNTQKEKNAMENNTQNIKTVDDLKAAFPALVVQIVNDAATAERIRIQDIENVALPGFETIVNDAKFTNPANSGDVAKAIIAAQRQQQSDYIANRDADAKNSNAGKVGASAGHEGVSGNSTTNEVDAAIDQLYPQTK